MQTHTATFVAPLPLTSKSSAFRGPRTRFAHRPAPLSRQTVQASAAPPARPPTQAPAAPLQVVPYPAPSGVSGDRAEFVSTCSSIPHIFRTMAKDPEFKSRLALVDEHHPGDKRLTYSEMGNRVDRMAAGLSRLGLRPGSTVSFFSENSHRWFISDLAIMTAGAAAAVRGVAAPVPELCYIYEHSKSRVLFVEDVNVLDRVIAGGLDREKVQFVVVLFGSVETYRDSQLKVYSYEEVLEAGANPTLAEVTPHLQRCDIATILYTSGTTGYPKGVVLTHSNLLSQLEDISLGPKLDPVPGEVFVSVLPCWHVFERMAMYWTLCKGVVLVYSNKRRFRDDLAEHKPHMLISVPRVFENLHAAVMAKLESASALRRALFAMFTAISLAFVKARRRLRNLDVVPDTRGALAGRIIDVLQFMFLMPLYSIADKLLWSKIRQGTGGRLRMCLSGGGSIAGYLEDFFECAGIEICVGYGMTETSPVIANRFGEHNVRGTTGMTLPRAYTKIVNRDTGRPVANGEQGTLHVSGPYVFSEYLYNPEATAKAFDADGYFDTGDLAYYTDGGDVVIAGRTKDVIVLSNGENIEPGPIEDAILASSLIDQIMLVGQDEKSIGALVVPKVEHLERQGLITTALKERIERLQEAPDQNAAELRKLGHEMENSESVKSTLEKEIKMLNQARPSYSPNDRVSCIRILLIPFSVENGMMTQTLKIKKDIVSKVYAAEIGGLYQHHR